MDLSQDVRVALRAFAKSPAFTLVVVLTLALGIGANAAIFALMDQVLLRLLPVKAPERLVILDGPGTWSGASHSDSETLTPMSHAMFAQLRDRNDVFEGVFGHVARPIHLTARGQTDAINGDLVTGQFFQVLGVQPALGRVLGPEDDRTPGGHPVVVLSHGFWQRRFAGDPKVLGQTVGVNGTPMTVVGVTPRGFRGVEVGASIDIFVPLMMQPQVVPIWKRGLGDWRTRFLTVMARLKDGVSLEQARAGANVLYVQLLQEDLAHIENTSERFRTTFLKKQLKLLPGARGTSGLRDQSSTPLIVLMGMVGLVLLIACANVANLLLARASSRQKEIAIRLALGASRSRLVRQLLVESLVLSLAGALLGLVFAAWTGDLLLNALPLDQASRALSADPDLRVGLFAFTLALLTGLVFGLAPALQSTRPQLAPTLKNESAALAGGGTPFRFRKGLVVAQVALSLLLLIGAGLFTRSLMNLRGLNPGFRPESLVAFNVDPALNGYAPERRLAVLQQIRDEIAAEPGVRSVTLAAIALMTNSNASSTIKVEGYQAKEDENMNPGFNSVAPGFFSTLGIPLLSGRDFSDADAAGAPRVAVVNETFARYYFGDKDPVGRRFGLNRRKSQNDIEIIGVAKDGKAATLREEPLRFVYLPYTQDDDVGDMTYYVRSNLDTRVLSDRLRALVRRADATLPVTNLKTMSGQISESLFVERMVAALSAAFGLLATLLAAVGLYGVMSYAVSLRTREIGIRVALGAPRQAVLMMVLREVVLLAALGVAIGLPSGYGLGRVVQSELFGLHAHDPLTYAVATASLLLSVLLAGSVPALRATRVDPMVALRYE